LITSPGIILTDNVKTPSVNSVYRNHSQDTFDVPIVIFAKQFFSKYILCISVYVCMYVCM
jgi:hypothetical protein